MKNVISVQIENILVINYLKIEEIKKVKHKKIVGKGLKFGKMSR